LRIAIVGAGLIGVSSAYFLNRLGHEVIVLDRAEGPGLATSFANGALLTPSMPEPWNSPGCWRMLLASLGRSDSAMQLRLSALPSLAGWGVSFLRNSRRHRYEASAVHNLRLALHSLTVMDQLRQATGIEYGRAARGSLRLFRDHERLRGAAASSHLASDGLTLRRLSRDETFELEPALAPLGDRLAGAIHYPADEVGDAYRFCVRLAEVAAQAGVEFRFGSAVESLDVGRGRVCAIVSGGEHICADHYVVAAGSFSSVLVRSVGVALPVQPVKGYSVTFARPASETAWLRMPVIDDDFHAVVVPLEDGLRVAGTAEFAGYDLSPNSARVHYLLRLLQNVLPESAPDPATGRPWCGLRAVSADGVPIVGATRVDNLWLNSGHGHLGWTMAAGSGELLAALISGGSPGVDPGPYALSRFG
jgi:D-amino-acid dehydrogenase